MVVGCEGHSSAHCLYCQMKQEEWKTVHYVTGDINCGATKWTINKLTASYLRTTQEDAEGNNADDPQGQKEIPIWGFIPIDNILIPVLHIVLGLGNDLLNNFLEWIEERI